MHILTAELARFLASKEPEVFCIRGRWGVGKTFGWNAALAAAINEQRLGFDRYAYVSLFGVNSIPELRNTIVEETKVVVTPPTGLGHLLKRSTTSGEHLIRRHARPLLNLGGGLAKIASGGDALYNLGFLHAENQLICLDDLERAGEKLPLRDTLGLVSLLKEQRGCKIVLLFNEDAMGKADQHELGLQLEKVVDTTVTFDPTPVEAAQIIFVGDDPVDVILKDRSARLGLTNLRVLKKIQRWGHDLAAALDGYRHEVRDTALATVPLAGWSIWQPGEAPPPEFLITYNGFSVQKKENEQTKAWARRIRDYGYTHSDEMDAEIIRSFGRGFFDIPALQAHAQSQSDQLASQERADEFGAAWKLYHHSFAEDDDTILDMMYRGALDGLHSITPGNMNSAIVFLRRYGRDKEASDLVSKYVEARAGAEGFLKDTFLFFDGERDPELVQAYDRFRSSLVDSRDPVEVLTKIIEQQGYNPEDVVLLSQLDATSIEVLLVTYQGARLKDIIEWLDRFSREESSAGRALRSNFRAAIAKVAARSTMTAARLRTWLGDDTVAESPVVLPKPKRRAAGIHARNRRRRIYNHAPSLSQPRISLRLAGRTRGTVI